MKRKNLFIVLLAVFLFGKAHGQAATALDWTKNECGHGASVHLFEMLDSGKVIVNDFVMLGACVQCGYASQEIEDIVSQFNVLYPGKVEFFSTGYDSSYSCTDMTQWGNTYGLGSTLFKDGTLEFNHYGGFGMPLVAVLGGGSNHTVFLQLNGYTSSDSTTLSTAIADAIVQSGVDQKYNQPELKIYPSPANEEFIIKSLHASDKIKSYSIIDYSGKTLKGEETNSAELQIDSSKFPAGMYFLKVKSDRGERYSKLIVTH